MKRRVILLGPPGAGKGTVAARLETQFAIPHVSSGDLLREEVARGTAVGREVRNFLEKGELVPDETVLLLMEQWLEKGALQSGFLLDGFPRTLKQARVLDGWLSRRGGSIELVLFYQCSEPVIMERITDRRICPVCGRVYHLKFRPPQVPGRCDLSHGPLVQREDDTEAVVRRRLQLYNRQTEPLVEYYRQQGKLTVVDGTKSADETLAESIDYLQK